MSPMVRQPRSIVAMRVSPLPACLRSIPRDGLRPLSTRTQAPRAAGRRMTLMSARPVIAVTIGDPAGIGPEIVVRAVALEAVRASAEIVVIGDRGRLQEAARATGIPPHFGETTSLIDLGNVPAGMPWGQIQAAAGRAAGQYIERAVGEAQTGRVEALAT